MTKIKKFILDIKWELLFWVFFVLTRVPSLGHDVFNTDVWKWKTRIYDFGSGLFSLNFAQTIQKYHPGVTLMWIGSIGVKIYNYYYQLVYHTLPVDNDIQTIFGLHVVQKFLVVVVIAFTLTSVFYVLRKLFGLKYAVVSLLILSFEPFYVALTRVIHLEGLMSTFMIASVVWLYYYLFDYKNKSRLYISSFFAALAVLTKISALFIVPFAGLMMFTWYYYAEASFRKALFHALREFLKWLFSAILIFVVLWPALWVTPANVFNELYRGVFSIGVEGGHEQFYFGTLTENPGFGYYFVVLVLRTSVLTLAGLGIYLFLYRKHLDRGIKSFVLYLLLFSLLYMLEISIPSKKLDRYILPTIMGFALVAGALYFALLNTVTRDTKRFFIGLGLLLLPLILTLVKIHPDYFSYYNPLAGGLEKGIYILEPKWMIGQREIQQYFREVMVADGREVFTPDEDLGTLLYRSALKKKLVVAFPEKYYTQIWPFIREMGGWAVVKELAGHAEYADYFVYPVWDDEALIQHKYNLEFRGVIKVRGVDIYNVYEHII